MSQTFEDVAGEIQLECPLAGPVLVRKWIQRVYNRVCDRHAWSWLRTEGKILIGDPRTGTAAVTRGGTVVTPGTLVFTAADIGRQLRTASGVGPAYTILDLDALNNAIIDPGWGDSTSLAQSLTIFDAYTIMPEDFGRFIVVIDPNNQYLLRTWITEQELSAADPGRTNYGDPWCVASQNLVPSNANASIASRIRYELYPYKMSAAQYHWIGVKRPKQLKESDEFEGALRHRTDIIVAGCLSTYAKWPGPDGKRPIQLAAAKAYSDEMEAGIAEIESRDEEIYMTWWQTTGINGYRWAPYDTRWAQAHDVSSSLGGWGPSMGFGW